MADNSELERFRALVEQTSDWLWECDLQGSFEYVSPMVAELLGFTAEEVSHRSLYSLMRPLEAKRAEALLGQLMASGMAFQALPLTFLHREGHDVLLETSAVPVKDLRGRLRAYRGISRDVSRRVQAEDRERLFSAVVRAAAEGILVASPDGRVIAVNPAFLRMLGYIEAQVLGQAPTMLELPPSAGRHAGLWEVLNFSPTWTGEGVARSSSGVAFPVWLSLSLVRDEEGAATGYVALVSDMTERRAAEETIRFQATHDALTSLANRAFFLSTFQAALVAARRDKLQVAVLFIDLDRFKLVNDRAGHNVGDLVLAAAARRLEGCVRKGDLVARFGGDEFTVCLSGTGVAAVAERVGGAIVGGLAEPFTFSGDAMQVGASVGVAVFPTDGDNVDALVSLADRAMYSAKAMGGGRLVMASALLITVQELAEQKIKTGPGMQLPGPVSGVTTA